jgi:hypothetical protein
MKKPANRMQAFSLSTFIVANYQPGVKMLRIGFEYVKDNLNCDPTTIGAASPMRHRWWH